MRSIGHADEIVRQVRSRTSSIPRRLEAFIPGSVVQARDRNLAINAKLCVLSLSVNTKSIT
jgi:hypothetical protein